jgi:hypothetical protein
MFVDKNYFNVKIQNYESSYGTVINHIVSRLKDDKNIISPKHVYIINIKIMM